jgi:DNA repair protein SbcD/Mre11
MTGLVPPSLYRTVRWTPNVLIFQNDRLMPVSLADGVTLWGAAHCAPANTDGFLKEFSVDRGGIHLALFHGSERHSLLAQGSAKMPHAPFDAADLERCGIHHAFLGHYHTPQDAQRFTYPGNPEPLTFSESGERGPIIITV